MAHTSGKLNSNRTFEFLLKLKFKFLAELEESKQQKLAAMTQQQQKATPTSHRGGLIKIGVAMKTENAEKNSQKEEKATQLKEPERPIEQFYEKLKTIFASNVSEKFTVKIKYIKLSGYTKRAIGRSAALATQNGEKSGK